MTERQRHILKVAYHLLQRYRLGCADEIVALRFLQQSLSSSELRKVEMQLTDAGEQHLHILPDEVKEVIEEVMKQCEE